MTITTNETGGSERLGMTFKMAGGKLRLEMDMSSLLGAAGGGEAAAMMSGAYMLLQSDGRMAMIVPGFQNPMTGGTGMGMIMDTQMLKGRIGADVTSNVDTTVAAAMNKVSIEDLGAGETILGHATRRYRITETPGGGDASGTEAIEVWVATDLPDAVAGFKSFGESFASSFLDLTSQAATDAITRKMSDGFPMRVVATSSAGKEMMRMEVSRAERVSFDDKEFEVPAGIQLMDMGAMLKKR
jgi:hypothetical protein